MSATLQQSTDPFATLRATHTSLRNDLQITRQITRGEPIYVLYDPVNFQAHRLSLTDYRVVAQLDQEKSLEACFSAAVAAGLLEHDEEEGFYRFVGQLDNLGLLSTSSKDGDALYERYKSRVSAERKGKVLSFLFLTIPLANPDKFLDRSLHNIRFLFSKPAFLAWCIGMFIAVSIVASKWSEFLAPLNSILAINNLVFMSGAFLALKIWHELGHGYACKMFGGRVPEMGCKLIVGMPLAYVDATSAWSFPSRLHRILVMLGGMYFETLVAIPATLVWAWMPETFIGSCAYQLIFMAGAATLLFNANPLMKYDGYFILSDLLGIPNLKTKSTAAVNNWMKHTFLGLRPETETGVVDKGVLLTYGLASSLYGIFLMVSIATMIAIKLHIVGLGLAAFQLGTMLHKTGKKLFGYLLSNPETEPVRARATFVAGCLAIGVPVIVMFFPLPIGLQLSGIVTAEQASLVRAGTSGKISDVYGQVGTLLAEGEPILKLQNPDTDARRDIENIDSKATRRAAIHASRQDLTEGAKTFLRARAKEQQAKSAQYEAEKLTIRAPHAGRLVFLVPDYGRGTFVSTGDPVAKVVAGRTQVRGWIDEDQLKSARIAVGTAVQVRLINQTDSRHSGTVEMISPVNAEEFRDLALTTVGEGQILVDPTSGKTQKPMYQVLVSVPTLESENTLQDARASLLVGRKYESLGTWTIRSARKFANSIFTN